MSYQLVSDYDLFGERPRQLPKIKRRAPVDGITPIWTSQKSTMICEYLHRFLLLAKSGVYLDLFAGPQRESYSEEWTIKKVIERRTTGPNFKYFAACDLDSNQVALLEQLRSEHEDKSFNFEIYHGDANAKIGQILEESPIDKRVPCFCLVDQRTLECDWDTVKAIAEFKNEGYKIEILYFLAQGWIDRAMKSTKDDAKLERWWGNKDYENFLHKQSVHRAFALCARCRDELNYKFADPWAIREHGTTGRTMYYLIHASDHPDARRLMSEAYRDTPQVGQISAIQGEMFKQ